MNLVVIAIARLSNVCVPFSCSTIPVQYHLVILTYNFAADSKVLQLDAVHQQHVQSSLDSKKRKTIEKLMTELEADQPEVSNWYC